MHGYAADVDAVVLVRVDRPLRRPPVEPVGPVLDQGLQLGTTYAVEAVVVPDSTTYDGSSYTGLLVNEGMREIIDSYALFARSFLDENLLSTSRHVEYLVDKQGYIRARWLPSEGNAWGKIEDLLLQAEILRKEKMRAPAPDSHVH